MRCVREKPAKCRQHLKLDDGNSARGQCASAIVGELVQCRLYDIFFPVMAKNNKVNHARVITISKKLGGIVRTNSLIPIFPEWYGL